MTLEKRKSPWFFKLEAPTDGSVFAKPKRFRKRPLFHKDTISAQQNRIERSRRSTGNWNLTTTIEKRNAKPQKNTNTLTSSHFQSHLWMDLSFFHSFKETCYDTGGPKKYITSAQTMDVKWGIQNYQQPTTIASQHLPRRSPIKKNQHANGQSIRLYSSLITSRTVLAKPDSNRKLLPLPCSRWQYYSSPAARLWRDYIRLDPS